MQGQRSSIGSLPETLGFDHGSTSSDPVIEPQICWNNMRNTSQNDANVTYMTSVNQEGPNLSGWNIGEPSSSGTHTHIVHNNERKIEHNWLSSMNDCNGSGPIFENRQYEPSNNLSLNNASNIINISDSAPQDLNMSSGFVGPIIIDDTQEMDIPIPAPDNVANYLEENEGRRLSCKRKALEGQSSASGSSSYFHRGEGSVWHPGYANRNVNNGLSISEVNPRLGLGVGGVGSESRPSVVVAQTVENSRRNLRLRINASSNQQDSIIPNNNNVFSSPHHHLLRLNPFNNLDLAAPPPPPLPAPAMAAATETVIPQGPRRSLQSSRWSRGSSSRSGGFLESSADEEANSRTIRSNFSEHQVFVPPSQSVVDWNFNNGGNLIVNGSNGASTSRGTGPSSNVNQVSPAVPPNWVPHHRHSSHYPRRLRELVHRSLMASESGVQNGNFAAASSSQELPPSSGGQGRHVSHSRAAMLLDRQQHEGAFGIPYPMRTLGSTGEGRSRLVSEHIRNVLDLMRRGEGLRLEDVMILDQSVFFGMAADIHDRHRDMRLDVDNMSYEELLALEERIGNVNTGLSEKIILAHLKQSKYVFVSTDLVEPEPCCVCQEEYNNGDDLGTLDCGHDFHSDCIKQWLTHKNICPICKTTALIT